MKHFILICLSLVILSCGSSTNSDSFIEKASGRYLINSDETITVYFEEKELLLKWRGAEKLKPMPVGDETFFMKEMNEKIQFLNNPSDNLIYFCLVPKEKTDEITYNYRKLTAEEQVPSYYFKQGDFAKAKAGYLAIKQQDSLDPNLNENKFNRLGYDFIRDKEYDKAIGVFEINIALFPESSNVYDSMGDVYLRKGDTINGVTYYRKAYALNSDNKRAKRIIEDFDKN